jgi:hypothetical protein
MIFAIDPGPNHSAYVVYDPAARVIHDKGKVENYDMHLMCMRWGLGNECRDYVPVVEMIASFGMPVGAEVFETCVWIGRFVGAWGGNEGLAWHRMKRHDVKMHLCRNPRAGDPNIRQALIDMFGPSREKAIGTKRAPGPLYGVSNDVWAALAVAVTFASRFTERTTHAT